MIRSDTIGLDNFCKLSGNFGMQSILLFLRYLNVALLITNNMNNNNSKLSFKEKLGYGVGDTASHFVWDMVGFWLLFFYTDVYKIPAAAAGTIMLIARFWDMGIDPVIGIISDRTQTRWGKFRPYILFGAIPYAVLAILTFTTPNLGETGKIIYAGATYVLLMTAYAAVNLPYSSLAAVMTSDTYERAGLNQYRFICAFVGQLVVTGLCLTLANISEAATKRWDINTP